MSCGNQVVAVDGQCVHIVICISSRADVLPIHAVPSRDIPPRHPFSLRELPSRDKFAIVYGKCKHGTVEPIAIRFPGKAAPLGNPVSGSSSSRRERAAYNQLPFVGRQGIDVVVNAAAQLLPRDTVPSRYMVRRGAARVGEITAGYERTTVNGQSPYRAIHATAQRVPADTVPAGNTIGGYASCVNRAGPRDRETATHDQIFIVDKQGIDTAVDPATHIPPRNTVPNGDAASRRRAGNREITSGNQHLRLGAGSAIRIPQRPGTY